LFLRWLRSRQTIRIQSVDTQETPPWKKDKVIDV